MLGGSGETGGRDSRRGGDSAPSARWPGKDSWAALVARYSRVGSTAAPDEAPASKNRRWVWVALGALVLSVIVVPQFVSYLALIVLVTGVVAIVRNTPTWLKLKTRKTMFSVVAAAGAVLLVASSVNAARSTDASNEILAASIPATEAESSPSPRPTPTRTPTPTPKRTVVEEIVTEVIPFEATTVEDGNLALGQTAVTVTGVNGEKTTTYRVTYEGDREVSRRLVSESVTVAPVAQVTSNGTYVAPPPPPPPPPPPAVESSCDPNYADACVPRSSDVDCAWGSGNGPAYLDGVARVVGSDIYGLDRDGDGYACERD